MTKLKIENSLGTFEFEGDDNAIRSQVENLVRLLKHDSGDNGVVGASFPGKGNSNNKRKRNVTQPKSIPDLLTMDDIKDLRKYYESKLPSSHLECFLVFALWLRDNKGMDSVSIDEIWTTYKVVGKRPPMNLLQVFRDGKSKKNFFYQSGKAGYYSITSNGETYVSFDLSEGRSKHDE